MNTVNETSAGREPDDYGPGVRAALDSIQVPAPDLDALAGLVSTVNAEVTDDGMVGPAYRVEPLDEIRQYERQIAGEPLDVVISRIIRRRDVGAMRHEQAVKEIMAAFAKASPPSSAEGVTVSELTAERFGPTGAQA